MSVTDAGYTRPEAARLAGLTHRQLRYWTSIGFLRPSLERDGGPGRWARYSFADVVELRTVARLLATGLTLRRLRDEVARLRRAGCDRPLMLKCRVHAGELLVCDGRRPAQAATSSGQLQLPFDSASGGSVIHRPAEFAANREEGTTPRPRRKGGAQ